MTDPEILVCSSRPSGIAPAPVPSDDPEKDVCTRDPNAPQPEPTPPPPQDRVAVPSPGGEGQGEGGFSLPIAPRYFSALQIAQALSAMGRRCTKKTVQRHALKLKWPSRANGNRLEYAPGASSASPEGLAETCNALFPPFDHSLLSHDSSRVGFADITDPVQRSKILIREAAVLFYHALVKKGFGKEYSLNSAIMHAYREAAKVGLSVARVPSPGGEGQGEGGLFSCSSNTLRSWIKLYATHGLNGLVEQKQGACGRKSAISLLSDDQRQDFITRGKALAIEYGAGGRPNVARAARELATHPDLAGPIREHLHGAHASKSHVTPSIRQALSPAPLTTVLAHSGTRAARLSSSFTPGDYSDLKAGDVFTADDITDNVVSWCEWPSAQGYRVGQAQILAVMDVRALRWLNLRLVLRESGQYNSDDIWGLFGDVFDYFGLPRIGFLLEGGSWQANKVVGLRTTLTDDDRIGGLGGLGLKTFRARGSTGKGMLETEINQLEYAADISRGFAGRFQRLDANENVQKQLRLCKTGHAHPRQFFPHMRERADHLRDAMLNLCHERNDGKILRGSTPMEQWIADVPPEGNGALKPIPNEYKWLYRSAMTHTTVTRNGARVQTGSGHRTLTYYYDNPELLTPRQGQKIIVYWNESNPETDAVILTAGKPADRRFLGVASYVQPLSRFNATDDQLAAEAARKKARLHFSRSELRSVAPELTRTAVPGGRAGSGGIPSPGGEGQGEGGLSRIGSQISAAADRQTAKQKTRHSIAREIANVEVTEDMIRAGTRRAQEEDFEL